MIPWVFGVTDRAFIAIDVSRVPVEHMDLVWRLVSSQHKSDKLNDTDDLRCGTGHTSFELSPYLVATVFLRLRRTLSNVVRAIEKGDVPIMTRLVRLTDVVHRRESIVLFLEEVSR